MQQKSQRKNMLRHLLEKEEKDILKDADYLKQALSKLRFEGRQHHKKNLSKTSSALVILKERLFNHMEEEENSLFPFLVTRLPRLESARHLFLSEHREFREKIKKIGMLLKRLKSSNENNLVGVSIQEVYSEGMYLTCLILSHVKIEGRQLYKAVENDLSVDEKKKLTNLLILNS